MEYQRSLLERLTSLVCRRLHLCIARVMVRPFGAAGRTLDYRGRLEFRAMRESEMLDRCKDPELMLRLQEVTAAFARGDVCVGALDGDELVGYVWLGFGTTPHIDGMYVEFDPRARYAYKKYVRPAYRGQRVGHVLSALADDPEFTRDRIFSISFIELANRASYKATVRCGSLTVGYAGYVRWMGRTIPFRSPGARKYQFQFRPDVLLGEDQFGDQAPRGARPLIVLEHSRTAMRAIRKR